MDQRIDKSQFEAWKKEPVTQKLMEVFQEMRHQINVTLLDESMIMDTSTNRVRLLGQREGLDAFLTVELVDVEQSEESAQ